MRRLGLLLLGAACAPDVPAEPTWTEDVMPILRANCVRCHGDHTSGGAPTTFRLDRFHTGHDAWGFNVPGAFDVRSRIAERISKEGGELPPMPPNGPPLSERQKEILVNWAGISDAARSLGPANRPPMIALGEPLQANVDAELTIRTFVEDPDGDYAHGELWYSGPGMAGPDENLITRNLRSGVGTHVWDTAAVAPGTYDVFAILVDDSQPEDSAEQRHALGTVTVAHPGGNTAPRISFESFSRNELPEACDGGASGAPAPDHLFHPSRVASNRVSVFVHDPDPGAPVPTVTFKAIRGGLEIDIVDPLTVNGCEASLAWTVTGVPDGTTWRIEATASDGVATRKATSPYVIVSNAATTLTYSDFADLIVDPIDPCRSRCPACHQEGCADAFLPDITLDAAGVQIWVGRIYRKVVEREEMPPESARTSPGFDPWLSDEQRALIGDWILGGAPP